MATPTQHKKTNIVCGIIIAIAFISFTTNISAEKKTADYYDLNTANLITALNSFQKSIPPNPKKKHLLTHFYTCRNAYKRTEIFIDAFLPYKARIINGPDLLKIDEENPSDSMKPHGFQVIERLIYEDDINTAELKHEIQHLINILTTLHNDPNRKYYFKSDKIWLALRLGLFRLVSMGITGFDVPLCYHAMPESKIVLSSIHNIAGLYKSEMADSVWNSGDILFKKAENYIQTHGDFNSFDRLTFIRSYLNPISGWLANCSRKGGYVNKNETYPLNPYAEHLFARDIIDESFFSPNDEYRPTPERIALGKKLFYDPILSGDGSRSCASCHNPERAFTDGLVKPLDITGKNQLLRNTPTLWNVALQTAQFYDSRTRVLENQMIAVVHNIDEMNGSLRNSIPKLNANTSYKQMFTVAYSQSTKAITEYNIANAVSSYLRTLIGLNSRFDRYMRNETDSFSASEKNGFNIFMGKGKCGTCHYAPLFNGLTPPLYQDTESETLAVPSTADSVSNLDTDLGKFAFTQHPFHKYSFKTSSVRNIALTSPYMHNGVFTTLEQVIDFYNDGGGAGRGIILDTQTLPSEKLNLSDKEKKDIVAFLQTLTDTTSSTKY